MQMAEGTDGLQARRARLSGGDNPRRIAPGARRPWIGGTENRHLGRVQSRGHVHQPGIVGDEKPASLDQGHRLSQARLTGQVNGRTRHGGRYLFPQPPWHYGKARAVHNLLERLHHDHWPLLAGAYVLVARKRVATLTPVKPRWRPRRAVLAGGGVAETGHGSMRRGG